MDDVDLVALAIKECTDGFARPVRFYVEPEAAHRWEQASPDKDYWLDGPGYNDGAELESYRIIARAALGALSEKK